MYVPCSDDDLLSSNVEQQLGIRGHPLFLEQTSIRQIWNTSIVYSW